MRTGIELRCHAYRRWGTGPGRLPVSSPPVPRRAPGQLAHRLL